MSCLLLKNQKTQQEAEGGTDRFLYRSRYSPSWAHALWSSEPLTLALWIDSMVSIKLWAYVVWCRAQWCVMGCGLLWCAVVSCRMVHGVSWCHVVITAWCGDVLQLALVLSFVY